MQEVEHSRVQAPEGREGTWGQQQGLRHRGQDRLAGSWQSPALFKQAQPSRGCSVISALSTAEPHRAGVPGGFRGLSIVMPSPRRGHCQQLLGADFGWAGGGWAVRSKGGFWGCSAPAGAPSAFRRMRGPLLQQQVRVRTGWVLPPHGAPQVRHSSSPVGQTPHPGESWPEIDGTCPPRSKGRLPLHGAAAHLIKDARPLTRSR